MRAGSGNVWGMEMENSTSASNQHGYSGADANMGIHLPARRRRALIPLAIPRSAKLEIRLAAPTRFRSPDLGVSAPNWRSNAHSVTCNRRPQVCSSGFFPNSSLEIIEWHTNRLRNHSVRVRPSLGLPYINDCEILSRLHSSF